MREPKNKDAGLDWWVRADMMVDSILDYLSTDVDIVYCEMCEHQGGSRGLQAEAKGSIIKLAYFTGQLHRACVDTGIQFVPVPVSAWKGQMSKTIVESRVKRIWGTKTRGARSHAYDALGILAWALGKF